MRNKYKSRYLFRFKYYKFRKRKISLFDNIIEKKNAIEERSIDIVVLEIMYNVKFFGPSEEFPKMQHIIELELEIWT